MTEYKYRARWTCSQCGTVGFVKVTVNMDINGGTGAILAASMAGEKHQRENGCRVIGVFIDKVEQIGKDEE